MAVVDDVELTVRLPFEPAAAVLVSPDGRAEPLVVEADGESATVRLTSLRLYGVVVFEEVAR